MTDTYTIKIGPVTYEVDRETGSRREVEREELKDLPPFERDEEGWRRLDSAT